MVEIPESYVLAKQLTETIVGKEIQNVTANSSPHAFAAYTGNPEEYQGKLSGKRVTAVTPGTGYTCGGNIEILCEDMLMVVNTPIKFHAVGDKLPAKHQMLIEFSDFSHMSCTVQMWGSMFCYRADENGLPAEYRINKSPSPMQKEFDEDYFQELLQVGKDMSVKAFLATEQRIPGLGNGALQDILFYAGLHPKRKLSDMSAAEKEKLFVCVKETLLAMTLRGGRDTEKDLFGRNGGYETVLSAKGIRRPCPVCGGEKVREAFLGGNIYFCPSCQELKK